MDAGDFDKTPAPSGRPSLSLLRDGDKDNDAPAAKRADGPRHHLLKTSASGPIIVDGDVPLLPRVREQVSKPLQAFFPVSLSSTENKPSASPSPPSSPDSAVERLLSDRSLNRPPRQPGRPNLHRGAPGPDQASSDARRSSSTETALLRSSRTGSSAADEPVMNHGSFHHGPSRLSKVRPVTHHYPAHSMVASGGNTRVDYRSPRSKVGPVDLHAEGAGSTEHQEIFASGSSTAVSLQDAYDTHLKDSPLRIMVDSLASQVPSFLSRHPKVQPMAQSVGTDDGDEPLASPGHVFNPGASKIRPFYSSDVTSPYGRHHKVGLMAVSPSSARRSSNGSSEDDDASVESHHHQRLHVPVAKVRPFDDNPFDAANFPHMHHHCPKAQAFSDEPSAFPSQAALDRCERCNLSGQQPHPVDREMAPIAHPVRHLQGKGDPKVPLAAVSSRHSISVDDKYPMEKRLQTHSISACGRGPAPSRGDQQAANGRDSQRKLSVTFPWNPESHIFPHRAERTSPLLSSKDPEDEADEGDAEGFVPTAVFGAAPPTEDPGKRQTCGSAEVVIHAPIPISKVRPHFQEHIFEMDARHNPVSKVRAAETGEAAQRERSTGFGGGEDVPKSRSQSLGSLLDYKRTLQWLKDVLGHGESHTTRLTQRPEQGPASSPVTRKNSENLLSAIRSARRVSDKSLQKGTRFDGTGFKRTVSDLEKLLNEALSIATQVVDRPKEEEKEEAPAKRPTCRHAATYSGLSGRPRLHEILRGYSGEGVVTEMRDYPHEADQRTLVSPKIPHRGSSKKTTACVDPGAHQGQAEPSGATEATERQPRPGLTRHDGYRSSKGHEMGGAPDQHHRHARKSAARDGPDKGQEGEALPESDIAGRPMRSGHGISLRRRSHVSLRGAAGFNLAKSRKRQPTARDWSPIRKRFVAAVVCISTALVGVILGIYAGLVPSIQYYIIDQSHATVHGNTGCFLGLAMPTLILWPLPLLHGRKPYILSSLRAMLLVSRTLMGAALGFASMNFHSTLLDLFGASLMSVNPHQEVVDRYDARRHGGGMGAWIGIWTWCWIGSLGVGFLVGACIIDSYPPAWGFYVSIIILAVVLLLNVLCPEVRRSAFRRSIAEVRTGGDISRRIARGEIMMHRVKTGPKWWGQEVYHGMALSLEMVRQPGFAVLTLYSAWIYAQVVLIMVLLGSLSSRLYQLRSPVVGLLVGSVAAGACLAIPFEKANVFSRSRVEQMNTNLATLNRRVAWSSHLVRRSLFALLLPLGGICYAAVSWGPPMHVAVPTVFAAAVGFLSCLAIAECNGLVMETFDCSDLSAGMVGRQRDASGKTQKRTNYSSFPRVTAGFAAIHGLAFILAAGATALGGLVTRTLGQQVATGVVAGILMLLTLLLLVVLVRFTEVQIIPKCKSEAMDRLVEVRRRSSTRRASMPDDARAMMEEERAWQPCMIGNPTGKKRRMNILELGGLTRWQEIRKKNRLIDANADLNREAWDQGLEALDDQLSDLQRDARDFLRGAGGGGGRSSKRSRRTTRRTDEGSETADESMGGGHGRNAERECVMSQTVEEEESGDEEEAVGRRR
ncbi:hypothetical protein L249_1531 [Ophiocordyceps polyrhachis-furcata BCC 54312]|uniref:Major facilitator superfamily (MFS) profile domain-containing protein n=1 Tax=Ophiocordyceps polyrhachis-furcata BCC 54312 TaxID=1330021 RepID=A0A367L498_9HYPO|nr:hypothetical protein L249_1531 [Ophiocordyceps polyrhachis-furcata BCC 54312]